MKIEAVKLMRNLRSQISTDIEGMKWDEEQEYLREKVKSFEFLMNLQSKKRPHWVEVPKA